MDIRGCIFDLDGVIVDTAKYHFLAWKRLADQMGVHFTEKDNERLKGVSRMDSLDIILEIGNIKPDRELKEKYARLKNEWYKDYISRMTPDEILPGSAEFINELKSAGIRTALGSASKNTPMILEKLGIVTLFDAVADGNIVKKAKPDPEVFLVAARMINVEPSHCIVFEDAVAGVQAALNAGMTCVGVGSEEVLTEAHLIISGLNEMNLIKLNKIQKKRL
ncbi:MAG: beta-phosphoglucomutase [Bacteroidetes bacterium RBG_13_44_24]|nr:MAG: beta-phosphoglucomutase [Bacteroidetes bacterium RBG_13_44_24]